VYSGWETSCKVAAVEEIPARKESHEMVNIGFEIKIILINL
jgi:hypothetical protein